ncbi:TetR/AcrR family transcriptional regulator [Methylobacterium sp. OT2]|uniref:TetR/AcrR family transcriptional regulator n=1 Tax=Methylobacterium sp. OT2 TaxID=2813779 RepID=UPI00197C46EA|nr:TetR/AcrR family transcriptional regulator [Methylobacterium sp. OT2]MBN4096037.1 TetR/AcrR family transcriptional regulator [Methylobacterium sp. OT2]
MSGNARETILEVARQTAQAHGYGGLSYRDLAAEVGIKPASIYHHFASKADLGAAVARRYWETTATELDAMLAETGDPKRAMQRYPEFFRRSLADGNRLCLCSFMSAEFDDLPEAVRAEAQAFADVHIAWLAKVLVAARAVKAKDSEARARAIFAAVSGAQLFARSRSDISKFDDLIESYRASGLIPA